LDLEHLFTEAYPRLFRYCHRLVGDRDAAEDVAQETFVRLWKGEVQGEPKALIAWLFKVATHQIRDHVRVSDNRKRLLEIHPVKPAGQRAPDEVLEREMDRERVRSVLGEQPERDRIMLLMREEGFNYQEIADVVEVAPGSVGTLLARALRRFKIDYEARYAHDES